MNENPEMYGLIQMLGHIKLLPAKDLKISALLSGVQRKQKANKLAILYLFTFALLS